MVSDSTPELTAFIPTSREEMQARGWEQLDVLFISGDAYIDHPAFGTALLARLLESAGYRVGILPQPDWKDPDDLKLLGRPRLFAAISAGAMDSMVNHYTASRRLRSDDAYTPGNLAGRRPNRAVIAYTAAIKGAFKGVPTVIGGIEASLRRLAHYDYWDDRVRRSVLVDSKADLLLYGMAESALVELARRMAQGENIAAISDLRGSALLVREPVENAVKLPPFEEVLTDSRAYNRMFRLASDEQNPWSGRPLLQSHADRLLQVNPPALPLDQNQLDQLYALPFQRRPHPRYREPIPAFEQIRHSITSHRGCFGGCAFCAITHHQGKTIQSRSAASILAEIENLTADTGFRGTVSDIGGPTANMYGLGCKDPHSQRTCRRGSCLYPNPCRNLGTSDRAAVDLLRQIRRHPRVRHAFISSGIRYDLLEQQPDYFSDLLEHHISGLLKVAPESTSDRVTTVMRKPGAAIFTSFLEYFRHRSAELGRRQALVPYLISGHPGCRLDDMIEVALYLKRHRLKVEQVQDFTPTPGSLATCIYYTGSNPYSGEEIYVAKSPEEKRLQKALLLYHLPEVKKEVLEALRLCGREDLAHELLGHPPPRKVAKGLPKAKKPTARPPRRGRRRP